MRCALPVTGRYSACYLRLREGASFLRWMGSPRRPKRLFPARSDWPKKGLRTGEAGHALNWVVPSSRLWGDISLLIYLEFKDIMSDMNRNRGRKGNADASDEDFLAELIHERTKKNANFPRLLEAAVRRRELVALLAAKRDEMGLTQEVVAKRMGTSQPAIARLEAGEVDAKLSTLERFATAVGYRIDWELAANSRSGSDANENMSGDANGSCPRRPEIALDLREVTRRPRLEPAGAATARTDP